MLVRGSWRVGSIAGIDIHIHPSWLVIYGLMAYSAILIAPLLAASMDATLSTTNVIVLGLIASLVLFASVVAHEFSHALVARRLGIPIGNITLFLFGGVASILREPGTPADELKMAAAGPAASVVIGIVFAAIALPATNAGWTWIATLCWYLAIANIVLAAFNLLPAFPSDGGRLLRAVLWKFSGSQARATGMASGVSSVVALGLIAGGVWMVLDHNWRGIWLVLIAFFLFQAALASGRQARVNYALERMRVGDAMARTLIPISADATLATLLAHATGDGTHTGYPVVEGGAFVGLVNPRDTAAVAPALWPVTNVGAIMTPAAKAPPLSVDSRASDALATLATNGVSALPVLENGELAGVVSEEIILAALRGQRATAQ